MTFEGDIVVHAPHRKVWDFFQSVDELARSIPGCQSVERIDAEHYRAMMVEKLGIFRVSFAMDVAVEEIRDGEFIRVKMKGIDSKLGSSFQQTLKADFIETGPADTRVHYVTDVQFLGKIASLGHSIIKRKVDEAMRKFGNDVSARLETA